MEIPNLERDAEMQGTVGKDLNWRMVYRPSRTEDGLYSSLDGTQTQHLDLKPAETQKWQEEGMGR